MAKKNQKPKTRKVTRKAQSLRINVIKFKHLQLMAYRLGKLRDKIWQDFGSINSIGMDAIALRNQWVHENRKFGVPVNMWKETLQDTLDNIAAYLAAAKEKVKNHVYRSFKGKENKAHRKELLELLKGNDWVFNKWLCTRVRKYWKRGHNHTYNQINVRSDDFTIKKTKSGKNTKLCFSSLIPRKRFSLPLKGNVHIPTASLRVLLNDNNTISVHYAVDEVYCAKPCGTQILGGDKGFTEVMVTSDGKFHGTTLGEVLTAYVDYKHDRDQKRNKLRNLSKNNKNILKNNLGTKKKDKKLEKFQNEVRTLVFRAIHGIIDDAGILVVEDLTANISSNKYGKKQNRRMSIWCKGIIAEAIESVSRRRRSTVKQVNAAYTSQMDSRTGLLHGKRVGDKFYCEDGVVMHADLNSAINVLARYYDTEIQSWMSPYQVKSILLKRLADRSGATA